MQSIKSSLNSRFSRLLLGQVVYADMKVYRFTAEYQLQETDKPVAWFAVLSRNCYRETVQWYPISKKADVIKLVKLQLAQANATVLYVVGEEINGKTPVTYYHLNTLPDKLRARCYLPETLLLGSAVADGELLSYQLLHQDQQVYVAKAGSGIVSALAGGVIKTAAQFSLSQGVVVSVQRQLSATQLIQQLVLAVRRFYRLPLSGLRVTPAAGTSMLPSAERVLWPVAIGATLYLLLAVQLSAYEAERATEALRDATRQADTILRQRQLILQDLQRYQQLERHQVVQQDTLLLWQVLAPLYAADVTFIDIERQQQQIILRFEAPSAASTLQTLISQPQVQGAAFDGPVRRQRNKDIATVRFSLQGGQS